MFEEFLNDRVKIPYRDGKDIKVARGILTDVNCDFVKVTGKRGTIVIHQKNIEKMSRIKNEE